MNKIEIVNDKIINSSILIKNKKIVIDKDMKLNIDLKNSNVKLNITIKDNVSVQIFEYGLSADLDISYNIGKNSSLELNTIIAKTASELGLNLKRGRVFTTDAFYGTPKTTIDLALENGCDVVEMESYALFLNAKKYHKRATSILTVTDEVYSGNSMPAKEREMRLNKMITLVLETIIKIKK